MNGTMLAARAYDGESRFRLEEVPVPEIGPEDVLVKVEAAGITRGLLSLWRSGRRMQLMPATLGHEIAGIAADVGGTARGVVVGQRVRVHPSLTNRADPFTEADNEPFSPDVAVIGHAIYGDGVFDLYRRYRDGGLAEYVKVPWWSLDALPDHVTFDVGSRVHSLGIAWRCFRRLQPSHGDTVLIAGATGATGGSAVLCAPHWGVTRVIAVSRTRDSLERTAAMLPGTVDVIPIEELGDGWEEKEGLTNRVLELTDGRGVDGVVDLMPALPDVTIQAMFGMRKGGTAVLAGGNWSTLSFPYGRFMYTNYTLRGSGGLTRRDGREVLRLLAAGRIDVSPLLSHRFPLERVNEAVELIDGRIGNPRFVTIDPPSEEAVSNRSATVATHRRAEEDLAGAAEAADPDVGATYEVMITDEIDTQWTGPMGIAHLGDVDVPIPHAKVGERFTVRVESVAVNPWTQRKQAKVEVL